MKSNIRLSKSKLLAFRQCPRRLWLEIHRPDLREDSAAAEAVIAVGHAIGDLARTLYDPDSRGVMIDRDIGGLEAALVKTEEALKTRRPLFEAGLSADNTLVFADVLLPSRMGGKAGWRLVEVKSSGSVKDYQRDDVAIQAYVAGKAGIPLKSVSVAHVDGSWVYPGRGDYQGLLKEVDLTDDSLARADEVKDWIREAHATVRKRKEPMCATGRHCREPYACGFLSYCQSQEEEVEFPVAWLPRIQKKALIEFVASGVSDMREVPDDLLNERQLRVKRHTLTGKAYFDQAGAGEALNACGLPIHFLDFETIKFTIPIWKGTRPFQQIPFQFSVHRLGRGGKLDHREFLDMSGDDPSKILAEELLAACEGRGTVFAYNASFEKTCIRELAERFPRYRKPLLDLCERIQDLRPIAEAHYYHPSQQGSWSLKSVLPAIAPDLDYETLDGVKDGGMAMNAYLEAIAETTTVQRREAIEQELKRYCERDTLGLARLFMMFSGAEANGRRTKPKPC